MISLQRAQCGAHVSSTYTQSAVWEAGEGVILQWGNLTAYLSQVVKVNINSDKPC